MHFKYLRNTSWLGWFSLLIILVAVVVRFYNLGQVPVSLYWDEVAMLADAKVLVESGRDLHGSAWHQTIFPSYGDMKLPVYIWSTLVSVGLFGVSEFALRLPSALAGLGSVIVIGLLAANLLKVSLSKKSKERLKLSETHIKAAGLVVALVVALSPWSVIFSRIGFEGHLGQFFLSLSIWFLSVGFLKKSDKLSSLLQQPAFWLSILFGAVATYSYFSVRYVWPLVFGLVLVLMSWQELIDNGLNFGSFKKWLVGLSLTGVAAALISQALLLPLYTSPHYQDMITFRLTARSILNSNDYALQSNLWRETAGNSRVDRLFYHRTLLLGRDLVEGISQNLSLQTLFVSGDPLLRHGTGHHGYFILPLVGAFGVGLIWLFRFAKALGLVLVGWAVAGVVPASVPLELPHLLRSLGSLPALSIVVGFGLWWLLMAFHAQLSQPKTFLRNLKLSLSSIYFLACLLFTLVFLAYYFLEYPRQSAKDWQAGYPELANELLSERYRDIPIYIHEFDDRFFLWWLVSNRLSVSDFRSADWENYHLKEYQNLQYGQFDYAQLADFEGSFIIAGPVSSLERNLREANLRPNGMKLIETLDPEVLFAIYYFAP